MIIIALLLILVMGFGVGWYLTNNDRGAKEPNTMIWAALGFGLLAVVLASTLNAVFIPDDVFKALVGSTEISSIGVPYIFMFAMMIGIVEETVKAFPLTVFIYKKSYFNEHTDGLIYFGLCGLSFSVLEHITYTLNYGASVGFIRLIIAPILHATLSGMFGFALVRYKLTGRSKNIVIGTFIGIILIHGLYDFGLFTKLPILAVFSLVLSGLSSAGLFVFYVYATKFDQLQGLSSVGTNKFCRQCGSENSEETLFCQSCGRKS